jgi:general secretion pathway protein N
LRTWITLLAFTLVAVLVWQWWGWSAPAPDPGAAGRTSPSVQTPSQPGEDPSDLLVPLGEKDEYATVTERPLFLPDRRPPSEEPEENVPVEEEAPSDLAGLDLNAVLITPSESSAWIRDPAKKELVRLRPGDELAGWSVQEILSDRVLLERQGEKDTLVLRDYKNMPPPVLPRRKPAARKRPERSRQPSAKSRQSAAKGRSEKSRPDSRRNLPRRRSSGAR